MYGLMSTNIAFAISLGGGSCMSSFPTWTDSSACPTYILLLRGIQTLYCRPSENHIRSSRTQKRKIEPNANVIRPVHQNKTGHGDASCRDLPFLSGSFGWQEQDLANPESFDCAAACL